MTSYGKMTSYMIHPILTGLTLKPIHTDKSALMHGFKQSTVTNKLFFLWLCNQHHFVGN